MKLYYYYTILDLQVLWCPVNQLGSDLHLLEVLPPNYNVGQTYMKDKQKHTIISFWTIKDVKASMKLKAIITLSLKLSFRNPISQFVYILTLPFFPH